MRRVNALFIGLCLSISGIITFLAYGDISPPESWTLAAQKSLNETTIDTSWELDTARNYCLKPLVEVDPTIRYYTFEITDGYTYIDNIKRAQTLINGKFPGPAIQAVEGDEIVVEFINKSKRPSSLHMHGLSMRGQNYMDGFTGLTQCAIQPGHSFTYTFLAQDVGTYWYHSHYQADTILGLYGPVLIQARDELQFQDYDAIIMLSDVYAKSPESLLEEYFEPYLGGTEPVPNQTLIQGKLRPIIDLKTGKKYRFHIINASSYLNYRFSIDNHLLNIIEVDGYKVRPRIVDEIPIASAQRYSFYVAMDMTSIHPPIPGYWIRANVDERGMGGLPKQASAVLSYEINTKLMAQSYIGQPQSVSSTLGQEFDDFDLKFLPNDPSAIPAADITITLNATMEQDEYGVMIPGFNGAASQVQMQSQPVLARYIGEQHHQHETANRHTFQSNQAVELIITNQDDSPHPFHLHGHKFWVLERSGLQASTPIKRDTVWIDQGQYVRVLFVADNPGVWGFHCHNVWHAVGGMEYTFVSSPKDLSALKPPRQWWELCKRDELPIMRIKV